VVSALCVCQPAGIATRHALTTITPHLPVTPYLGPRPPILVRRICSDLFVEYVVISSCVILYTISESKDLKSICHDSRAKAKYSNCTKIPTEMTYSTHYASIKIKHSRSPNNMSGSNSTQGVKPQ